MTIHYTRYRTAGGVTVERREQPVDAAEATDALREQLDAHRGVLLSSSVEFSGRYSLRDVGCVNPPIAITARGRQVEVEALNRRGRVLLPELYRAARRADGAGEPQRAEDRFMVPVPPSRTPFAEEERSRQPSVFSVLRAIIAHFSSPEEHDLGLYGAFGYDLAFQFEPVAERQVRAPSHRDLVLYLPDELVVVDHHAGQARRIRYDFICRPEFHTDATHHADLRTTGGLAREGACTPYHYEDRQPPSGDHPPGEYEETVREAQRHFGDGRLFEVVPGQVFFRPCQDSPARVFERLRRDNPSPYGALINLGEREYLIAASPEMYVRVRGCTVETCPISGTIARGDDALADARQIRRLLNSAKDEAELSMCTDVDRNDKSRVCVPGSVRVIGRRQIELYSRLIHTVDHVTGHLASAYDALDAFLAHTWAVTVTGAPKAAAMQFIEDHEKSPRHWYGGAMGMLGFDGDMNTGLTLRTIRVRDGTAEVRAGATLLSDSDPAGEEAETRLKASALLSALQGRGARDHRSSPSPVRRIPGAEGLRVLLVDHHDSFVHNLGSYFREYGVVVTTLRPESAREALRRSPKKYDLAVLSPGPGRPDDFAMRETLALCEAACLPVFGVCLGMQGIAEYFGGRLEQLPAPMHGKSSTITHAGDTLFREIPDPFEVGRYHSLHVGTVPESLRVIAQSVDDDVVMALEHCDLSMAGVQFHPESIMTLEGRSGHRLIGNVLELLRLPEQGALQHPEAEALQYPAADAF